MKMRRGRTKVVGNLCASPTPESVFAGGQPKSMQAERARLEEALGQRNVRCLSATDLCAALVGEAAAANVFALGFAYQLGWIPLGGAAIERAVELNGAAVKANLDAFRWGRRTALDPDGMQALAASTQVRPLSRVLSRSLDELIDRRAAHLAQYQDDAYAHRYRRRVERVRQAEAPLGGSALTEAVARQYARLLAYKDEYEVARLHAAPEFRAQLDAAFEGNYRLRFHLSPPWLSRTDAATGRPKKRPFGQWILKLFGPLASLRRLRGTAFDVFGYSDERREERRLIAEYEVLIDEVLESLDAEHLPLAVELASLPSQVSGFGPVKAERLRRMRQEREALLRRWRDRATPLKDVA